MAFKSRSTISAFARALTARVAPRPSPAEKLRVFAGRYCAVWPRSAPFGPQGVKRGEGQGPLPLLSPDWLERSRSSPASPRLRDEIHDRRVAAL